MTNQTCSNRPHHAPQYVVAIVALVLAFAALPRGVFGQAATGPSGIKIGIIGSGNLGGTLGTLWVKSGHPVLFSSRHPEELKKLVDSLGPLARSGTVREALAFGDVIFVAVPYAAYPQIGRIMRKSSRAKLSSTPAMQFRRGMARFPRKRVRMESA